MALLFALGVLILTQISIAQDDEEVVGFHGSLENNLINVPGNPIIRYGRLTANTGDGYDEETDRFIVPDEKGGHYYFSISLGVPTGGYSAKSIHRQPGGQEFVGIRFNNTVSDGAEYASRGFMRTLPRDEQQYALVVRADTGSSYLGSPYYTTSWSMFRYEEASPLTVCFSAARAAPFYDFSRVMPFGRVLLNDGGWRYPPPFNTTGSYFTAPTAGFYFFHLSAASEANFHMKPLMYKWSEGVPEELGSLNRTVVSSSGQTTTGRSLLTELQQDDQVTVGTGFDSAIYSSPDFLETSFSGFGYALADTDNPDVVAVFAAYTELDYDEPATMVLDNWDEDSINFNPGSEEPPFDPERGLFIAPVEGTYFVSFSAASQANKILVVRLIKTDGDNTDEVSRIDCRSTSKNGYDTLSRDAVVTMNAGEALFLEVVGGSAIYSGYGRETSLTIIRLYSHPDTPPQ